MLGAAEELSSQIKSTIKGRASDPPKDGGDGGCTKPAGDMKRMCRGLVLFLLFIAVFLVLLLDGAAELAAFPIVFRKIKDISKIPFVCCQQWLL